MYFKKALSLIFAIAMLLVLASCNKKEADKENGENATPGIENGVDSGAEDKSADSYAEQKQGEIIGDYKYPTNPTDELREALISDANERGLPVKIGSVETVELERKEYSQIRVDFTDGSENVCIISFFMKHLENGWDESLDGQDNPSFTMAFKDPDNSRDMVMLLTSVIKYLSPDLSLAEAERLAGNQDKTIGTDGYAQPKDIGGYQVQARYTNPKVFVSAGDFEAKLGVNVRAIKQIWRGTIDTRNCLEMTTVQDYNHLTANYNSLDEGEHPGMVYADFIVKNTWRDQSYIHGETWVVVNVESMTGQEYSISMDTWAFPNAYEFGVGQRYTLFIGLNYTSGVRGGIMYAVQQSESEEFNSRGEQHPLDYPTEAWYDYDRLRRIEPEEDGAVYNVYFVLQSQTWGEAFAALEGHGIGEAQWPGSSPGWDDYAFVGWYDNTDWNGEPYTKDTPIYKDTALFARWKYTGSGGAWPRAHRGEIQGIDEGESLSPGQNLTITVSGYNMNLVSPKEQHFRWLPLSWRLSDGASGSFSENAPFESTLSPNGKGEQKLYITYAEEIYDSTHWQATGQVREVEEITFQVD